MRVGRFRPIATASMGALTSQPPVPVKRTVGFVVVDMALAAAAKTTHAFMAALTLQCKQEAWRGLVLRCVVQDGCALQYSKLRVLRSIANTCNTLAKAQVGKLNTSKN